MDGASPRRLSRRAAPLLLAMIALLVLTTFPATVVAAATFGRPAATATYGREILFEQPVSVEGQISRVEILIEAPGALGPNVVEVPSESTLRGATLTHRLDLTESHLLPNTTLTARWRISLADGSVEVGPSVSVRYADTRLRWRTLEGRLVRVHWHEGSDEFGRRALEIGERAVEETAALLGVTETDPIDFFVYADQAQFYEALGPGTRENVGGQANASIRTLFALVGPRAIDDPWVEIVIPHELVHLVFDTAVTNPYHYPPRWLNEGLAVYLSEGYGRDNRRAVESAAGRGSLIPLDGLAGQFPTTYDRFVLAYAESVSAVDFLIREYGRDALIALIRSYADGVSDDEAFEAALGLDVAAFDAAWRADVGADEPSVHGPRPAPPGPLPPGWEQAPTDGIPPPGIGPTPVPGATPPPGGGTLGGETLAIVVAAAALAGVILAARAWSKRARRTRPVTDGAGATSHGRTTESPPIRRDPSAEDPQSSPRDQP